jgi:conjugative transposon TraN protein
MKSKNRTINNIKRKLLKTVIMKKTSAVWLSLVFLLFIHGTSNGQEKSTKQETTIQPEGLTVSYDKTVNVIFPYAIKSVDKGSKDILVQIAKGVENILQVKAARQGFDETNLTVVTANGKLYSYLVNYSPLPSTLNIKVGSNMNHPASDALFSYKSDNEAKVYDLTEQISTKMPVLKNISDHKYDVRLSLWGSYIKDDKLYFQFNLENSSYVDYAIEALRFFIIDQKKSRRTAAQEVEVYPVAQVGNTEIIRGRSRQNIVITLPKFTIPDNKLLSIRMTESNGGRHLNLNLKNNTIVGSSLLP